VALGRLGGLKGGKARAALHFMFYNFGRIHQTLRVTPAMEAGLTDHVWTLEEIAELTDCEIKQAEIC
jgi:hypothetical protein